MAGWLFPICNAGFKTTLKWFSDLSIVGQDNLPKSGPLIVVSNHLSNLDPAIVAAALPESPVFLAKNELFKFPFMSSFMRAYGAFPVNRRKADLRAVNWLTRQLVSERRMAIVFPEGTRSKSGGLLQGQSGIARIALSPGVPIIPFALTGSENLQSPVKVFKPTATLRLTIGASFVAIPSRTSSTNERASLVTTEIMIRIARMLPEGYRGRYSDHCDIDFSATADYSWSNREVSV